MGDDGSGWSSIHFLGLSGVGGDENQMKRIRCVWCSLR